MVTTTSRADEASLQLAIFALEAVLDHARSAAKAELNNGKMQSQDLERALLEDIGGMLVELARDTCDHPKQNIAGQGWVGQLRMHYSTNPAVAMPPIGCRVVAGSQSNTCRVIRAKHTVQFNMHQLRMY